jgi:hypothetical protein
MLPRRVTKRGLGFLQIYLNGVTSMRETNELNQGNHRHGLFSLPLVGCRGTW